MGGTYHQRQDTLSVNAPPMRGPITAAIAYAEPKTPVNAGRSLTGAETPMMMKDPPKVPATPIPAMARPAISVMLFCATAKSGDQRYISR
jgi:hypothetical protein